MQAPVNRGATGKPGRPKVVIAGGGVAAVEAMLALRDLAGDRVEVELHAPRHDFVYRPLAVGEPFAPGRMVTYELEDLARRAGAKFCLDSVVDVEPDRQRIVTQDHDEVHYDHLLLCAGARRLAGVSGADTFWGVRDEGGVFDVTQRLREGELKRVAFAMPTGSWPLPIYELALLAEAQLAKLGRRDGVTLTIVTPEEEPLGLFGVAVGERMRYLLNERGIALVTAAHPVKFADGLLQISPGDPVAADAVISAARIEGRKIGGIDVDPSGFVPVDEFSRVIGMEDVYAAGDMTAFPVKQGGLATQQADAAVEAIAAAVGVDIVPQPFDPVLRATLWTGEKPQYLYGRLAAGAGETSLFSDHTVWEHEGKIVGRYLAPFLRSISGGSPADPIPAGV